MLYNEQYHYWVDEDYEEAVRMTDRYSSYDRESGSFAEYEIPKCELKAAVLDLCNELYNARESIDKKKIANALVTLCTNFNVGSGIIEDIQDLDCMVIEHYKEKDREAERVKNYYKRELAQLEA